MSGGCVDGKASQDFKRSRATSQGDSTFVITPQSLFGVVLNRSQRETTCFGGSHIVRRCLLDVRNYVSLTNRRMSAPEDNQEHNVCSMLTPDSTPV